MDFGMAVARSAGFHRSRQRRRFSDDEAERVGREDEEDEESWVRSPPRKVGTLYEVLMALKEKER